MSAGTNHRTIVGIFTLLALGTGTLTSLAGWTPRTLMSSVSSSYQCTSATAAGPDGDAVAGWLDEPSGLAYAAVRRGAVWGASKPIYKIPVNAPEQITEVRVAVGGDGTAIATFVLSHFDRYSAYQVVMAATMARGATVWSPSVEVSPRGSVGSVMLATDAAGDALLLWRSASAVISASRPVGGLWSAPQTVPACPRADALAMNAAGTAVIAWSEGNGAVSTLRSMNWSAGGGWSTATVVALVDGPIYGLRVGMDGQGLAAAAWQGGVNFVYDIGVVRETAPGTWDAPQVVNEASVSVYAMDFGMDAAGDMAIAWSELDSLTGEFRIHAQVRRVHSAVADQMWITTDVGVGTVPPPSVAISPDGSLATVAWIDDSLSQAFAASFTPATGWSVPALIGWGLYENTIALACGTGSTATAVWPLRQPVWQEFRIGFGAATYNLVYPVPVLSSVTPWMAQLGGASLDVLATGRNFLLAGATRVQWDGADRTTDALSSSNAIGHLTTTDLSVEGLHQVTVLNVAPGGGVSKALPFLVDGTAPATTMSLTGKLGLNGWYTGSVQVSLTATDSLTGIKSIAYQVDALAPVSKTFALASPLTTPRSSSFGLSAAGVHTVRYGSTDNVGITDVGGKQTIKIDTTAPVVTAAATPRTLPAADQATAPVTVSGAISDALSGVDVSGAQFSVWDEYGVCQPSGPVTVAASGAYTLGTSLDTHRDGVDTNGRTYKITVSAKDLAGLVRNATVTVTVK